MVYIKKTEENEFKFRNATGFLFNSNAIVLFILNDFNSSLISYTI